MNNDFQENKEPTIGGKLQSEAPSVSSLSTHARPFYFFLWSAGVGW